MSVNKTISLDFESEKIWHYFYKELEGDFSSDIQGWLKDRYKRLFEVETLKADIGEAETRIEQEKRNIEIKKDRLRELGEKEQQKIKEEEIKKAIDEERKRLWDINVYVKHIPLNFEKISDEQVHQLAEEYVSIPFNERPNWLKYFQEVKGLKLKEKSERGF
jgi:hypothetical protein